MDIAAVLDTGGPLAVFAAFAGFFLKAYLEKRKGDREDRKAVRESESLIVETTKEALRIVRDQIGQMYEETQDLRSQIAELEARLRAKDAETQDLRSQITELSLPSQRSPPPDVTKDLPHSMPK